MSVRTDTPPWTITLRLVHPGGTRELVRRTGPSLEIGSARDVDLVLADPAVAATHCLIVERRGAVCLLDRGAPGGTALNFTRIAEPTPITAGDKISLGDHVLVVISIRPALAPEQIAARLRRGAPLFGEATLSGRRPDAPPSGAATPSNRPDPLLDAPTPSSRRSDATLFLATTPSGRRPDSAPASRLPMALGLVGSLLGATLAAALPGPSKTPNITPVPLATRATPSEPIDPLPAPLGSSSLQPTPAIEHELIPDETLADVAALYGVDPRLLARWNDLSSTDRLQPGQRLRVYTTRPPLVRELIRHRVRPGESWDVLARRFGVDPPKLRAHNRHLGDTLRAGDILDVWAPRRDPSPYAPAAALVPTDATSTGRPSAGGRLERALQLPPHPDYDLRCPFNAHASSHTATHLLSALARLRATYRGQLVVGDLSREDGGAYGPHLSHQSGRDVDLWLPIAGGLYRTDPACSHCGTPWCRPEPREVDWDATWRLIAALESTGAVKQIFLDRAHFPALRRAARTAGLDDPALARAIQPRRGAPALVTHSAGHTRHLHVRFRCGPDEPACVD